MQLFFTDAAGCGKTYMITLIKEIYNRFCHTDGYVNSYIACASTGNAAVAIDGITIHPALRIAINRLLPLSFETVSLFRTVFRFVKIILIDEISMVSAQMLQKIDSRLKQITGNIDALFGGLDIILIGDLRQLPPVRATPIYKQCKTSLAGASLWQCLKYYSLDQVK